MSELIDIRTDFTEAEEYLNDLGKYQKQIMRYVLTNIGRQTARKIKKSYNVYLHKKTSNLYKNIKSRTSKRKLYNVVVSDGTSDDKYKARYGYVLAQGTTIKPKDNDKYLTFQVDGKWKKMKEVHIPSRSFVEEPGMRYLNSSEMAKDREKYLQKKLNQLERQGKIERIYEE